MLYHDAREAYLQQEGGESPTRKPEPGSEET